MFKKEALPFAAGFCMCLGIFGIGYLMYLETEQRFDPADHPRSQSFEATAYMKESFACQVFDNEPDITFDGVVLEETK